MIDRKSIKEGCLYFSSWSKKGYSIFVGLGREVRISRLALHMFKNILLKSASNGVIVNTDHVSALVSFFPETDILKDMFCLQQGVVYPDVCCIRMPEKDVLQKKRYIFFV